MPINFRSKLHQKLLRYYFANPDREYYVRELSRELSFDVSIISRELKEFVRYGILTSSKRGSEKYFKLNKNHQLYNEIRTIIKSIK